MEDHDVAALLQKNGLPSRSNPENTAVRHNYEVLLTSTAHDPKRIALAVRRMIERRVEGVAVVTFGVDEAFLKDLASRNVPLVFLNVAPPLPRVSNIRIDHLHGIRQAVQHLAALRHRRIAFISGPLRLRSAGARQEAFAQCMEEIGLANGPEYLVEGDHTMQGGIAAMQRLLRLPKRPTAVLCANDMTALGAMRESYIQGIHVPMDLSVVGFDDIRLAQFVTPRLTTVRMSQKKIARLVFNALLAEVQRKTPLPNGTEYTLTTTLVLRDSTALAPRE